MKKSFAIVSIIIILVAALTACSQVPSDQSASPSISAGPSGETSVPSAAPSPSESMSIPPVNPEVSGEVAKDGADYMGWKAEDWKGASDEDKKICASTYLIMVDPDAVKLSKDEFDASIEETIAKLDKLFDEKPGKTLEELKELE